MSTHWGPTNEMFPHVSSCKQGACNIHIWLRRNWSLPERLPNKAAQEFFKLNLPGHNSDSFFSPHHLKALTITLITPPNHSHVPNAPPYPMYTFKSSPHHPPKIESSSNHRQWQSSPPNSSPPWPNTPPFPDGNDMLYHGINYWLVKSDINSYWWASEEFVGVL